MTCALELRQVSKVYGSGPDGGVRASRRRSLGRARRARRDHGAERLGQEHALDDRGQPRGGDSGQVLVDGIDLATISRSEQAKLRRRSIGYVFQDFNLLPGLTALENVTLPLELDGSARQSRTGDGAEGTRRARRRGSCRPLPRRAVRRRAPACRDRPGDRRRARVAARRRADRRARLGERRGRHAPAAGRHPAWRRRCRRHPRGAPRVVGRPRRLPARRPGRRPDGRHRRARSRSSPTGDRHDDDARSPVSAGRAGERRRRRPSRRRSAGRGACFAASGGSRSWCWLSSPSRLQPRSPASRSPTTRVPPDDARVRLGQLPAAFDGTDPRELEAGLDRRQEVVRDDRGRSATAPSLSPAASTRWSSAPRTRTDLRQRAARTPPRQLPDGPGQVAVTDGVADLLALEIGDTLALDGRRRTVVGIVENPRQLTDEFALVSPATAGAPDTVTLLVAADAASIDALSRQSAGRPVRLVGVRRRGANGQTRGHTGDVLGGHRLPASGLAGRRRGLHRHRAATTPPTRHACRDRRDTEAPATRAADERRRRRRHRRGDRDDRRSRALVRGPPDPRDRVRPPHRPAQPALDTACAGRPHRHARRHRRRLVAGAGGHPRPRHPRPLCATPEAEARTSFGDCWPPC